MGIAAIGRAINRLEMFWNFTRSPASVELLLNFGRARGLTTSQLLAGTRLTAAQLGETGAAVSASQEIGVVENLIRLLPDEAAIGLRIGLTYHVSAYGVLGLALMSSANGIEALRLAMRFLPLTFSYVAIEHSFRQGQHTLTFSAPSTISPDLQQFVIERAVGATVRVMQDITASGFELSQARLAGAAPARLAPDMPRCLLGASLQWKASENMLSTSQRFVAQPLPLANPTTAAMCERMCEDLVRNRKAKLSTTSLIREYLAALPDDGVPKIGDIALMLNTSERTLKRWFLNEGISYRELIAESRHAKANRLLADPALTLTEVANSLGFSDLSSFSQAYKRWTGLAPSTMRSAG